MTGAGFKLSVVSLSLAMLLASVWTALAVRAARDHIAHELRATEGEAREAARDLASLSAALEGRRGQIQQASQAAAAAMDSWLRLANAPAWPVLQRELAVRRGPQGAPVRAESGSGRSYPRNVDIYLLSVEPGELLELTMKQLGATSGAVRECFDEAVARSAVVKATVTLAALVAGEQVQAHVVSNSSSDAPMADCMRTAIRGVRSLPNGLKFRVEVQVHDPVAAGKAQQPPPALKERDDGKVESSQQVAGVDFRVVGPRATRDLVRSLVEQFRTRLPGALDCRRKALAQSPHAKGVIELSMSMTGGQRAQVRASQSDLGERATSCFESWLARFENSPSSAGELTVFVEVEVEN